MSFLSRIWRSLGSKTRYVGRDLEGNRFFENPSSSDDPRRTKRTVQYGDPENAWRYIGGGKRLPVQWSAWMTHTRPNPPTLEELQSDVARQQRVKANVVLIEARDREERAQLLRMNSGAPKSVPSLDVKGTLPEEGSAKVQNDLEQNSTGSQQNQGLPKMAPGSNAYEPEPWTPQVRGRGT